MSMHLPYAAKGATLRRGEGSFRSRATFSMVASPGIQHQHRKAQMHSLHDIRLATFVSTSRQG